jgi:hypothetical protein
MHFYLCERAGGGKIRYYPYVTGNSLQHYYDYLYDPLSSRSFRTIISLLLGTTLS